MKALVRNIIALAFGLYFLLVGTGFNLVNYCCNVCELEGIEAVAMQSCHSIHHSEEAGCCDHQQADDMACTDLQHHPDACHLTRLSVELSPLSSVLELNAHSNYETVLLAVLQNNFFETCLADSAFNSKLPPPDKVLLLTGEISLQPMLYS